MVVEQWWEFEFRIPDSNDRLKIPPWIKMEGARQYRTKQEAVDHFEKMERHYGAGNLRLIRCERHVDR